MSRTYLNRFCALATAVVISLSFGRALHGQSLDDQQLRVAAFNVELFRGSQGQLANNLAVPGNGQINAIAEIVQRVNPDVILLNEFDLPVSADGNSLDTAQLDAMISNLQSNYMGVSQNGHSPISFSDYFAAPVNTGVQPEDALGPGSDFDFNNAGGTDQAEDAFGFGQFPGQYGMVVLSKHPIMHSDVRTFQKFLWKDMPGANLPDNPATPTTPDDWYSPAELDAFRLSSKSHWDVPIQVNGETLHVLASHPTPPVFDGAEDRNGLRNFDEIRFWNDYITPGQGDYIYDDQQFDAESGTPLMPEGGLAPGSKFVIAGDLNADPFDGDSTGSPTQLLLNNPLVNTTLTPTSAGALEQSVVYGAGSGQSGPPEADTATFAGNLRVDYVLPSANTQMLDAGVFWPEYLTAQDDAILANIASEDHRLVWAEIDLADPPVVPIPTAVWVGVVGLGLTIGLRRIQLARAGHR